MMNSVALECNHIYFLIKKQHKRKSVKKQTLWAQNLIDFIGEIKNTWL